MDINVSLHTSDIPIQSIEITYGTFEGAEWIKIDEATLFISGRSKEVVSKLIKDLQEIFANLWEEEEWT